MGCIQRLDNVSRTNWNNKVDEVWQDHDCKEWFVGGRMVWTNSSFSFTGSGGICFITSGISFKLSKSRSRKQYFVIFLIFWWMTFYYKRWTNINSLEKFKLQESNTLQHDNVLNTQMNPKYTCLKIKPM